MINFDLTTVLTLVSALLGGGTVAAVYKAYVDRKKTDAEAQNIHITGELSISESWMKYATELKGDMEKLKDEISTLTKEVKRLTEENIELKRLHAENEMKIKQLKEENTKLKQQITN